MESLYAGFCVIIFKWFVLIQRTLMFDCTVIHITVFFYYFLAFLTISLHQKLGNDDEQQLKNPLRRKEQTLKLAFLDLYLRLIIIRTPNFIAFKEVWLPVLFRGA